ncbi:MAG: hypothetical protein HKO57_09510 [Akkermansiaceae bacterium]|nr:hypothetical protein [Akkermansiaceae bacterium]
MPAAKYLKLSLVLGLPLLVAGCDGGSSSSGGTARDVEIDCHFFHRASTARADGESKSFTITVPFVDGPVPEIDLGIGQSVSFGNLTCGVAANYNTLDVTFSDSQAVLSKILYQLPEEPVDFAGGFGFTGLHYVYDRESGAELQFWAEARGEDREAGE